MPVRVTLNRGEQVLTFPSPWWVALVNLAVRYGWKPSPASQSDRDEALADLFLARVPAEDALRPRWARSKYARTVGDRRCACQATSATSWRTTGAPSRVMWPSRFWSPDWSWRGMSPR